MSKVLWPNMPFKIIVLFIIIWMVIASCRKDENYQIDKSDFKISQDTLLFDTVFTSIGSATKRVKVYNNESDPITINVRLEKGSSSMFRMNVNGFQGDDLKDIEIPALDSIYIFLEVTVDPDDPLSISPYVIEDKLIVSQSTTVDDMQLIAWGQNANYISQRGEIRALACNSGSVIFNDDKPYVIYGILIIDSCELIIPAGRSIHVHGGVVSEPGLVYNDGQIIVFPEGKLTVQGTVDNPVKFEGDRLEPDYEDIPGQWVGIRIFQESEDNLIEYAEIKNSIIGVIADSASSLQIKNTIIKNTSGASLIGIHSTIYGENLLLQTAGSYNLQLTYGGDYSFNYCTLVNESNQREALYVNNYKCTDLENDPLCTSSVSLYRNNVNISNSIIYGPSNDEIALDDYTQMSEPNLLNYKLDNCIVRVDEILDVEAYPSFFDNCKSCLNYNTDDILFRNFDELDFRLDTMSIAENKALPISGINQDLLGFTRDISNPDVGCYEFEN